GELYASGGFTYAGGAQAAGIARWNGTIWQDVAGGLAYPGGGTAQSFVEYNGELLVAGTFNTAGSVTANGVARWNGTTWQATGSTAVFGSTALAVYNGTVIAAVSGAPKQWTGSAWMPFGAPSGVEALTVWNGELFAGGNFSGATGVSSPYLVKWGS